jgi:hypothetical protein
MEQGQQHMQITGTRAHVLSAKSAGGQRRRWPKRQVGGAAKAQMGGAGAMVRLFAEEHAGAEDPNAAAAQALRRLAQLAKVAAPQPEISLRAGLEEGQPALGHIPAVPHFDLSVDDSAALRHFDLSALDHIYLSEYFGECFDLTATGPDCFGLNDLDESDTDTNDSDAESPSHPWAAL